MTDELAQARTRKKEFLEQMERIIPWSEWMGIIKPHYYKGERGNKPYELNHAADSSVAGALRFGGHGCDERGSGQPGVFGVLRS